MEKKKSSTAVEIFQRCLDPQKKVSKNIEQFRIIPLLSLEGNILFSIVVRRLAGFLSRNNYRDMSVQTRGIAGELGCLGHTVVVTQLIREVRVKKGDLTVLWLDLANAYSFIPHKLVETTMTKHHVSYHVVNLIQDY